MNILFILGNGFDLNLGLKTSYNDFISSYLNDKSQIEVVKELHKTIFLKREMWSDIELALGEYTKSVNHSNEFHDVFEHIGDSLAEYLETEEAKFSPDLAIKIAVKSHLTSPEKFLSVVEQEEIEKLKLNYDETPNDINIVTFNYTRCVEKILGDNYPILHENGMIRSIHHIHGYTNERMIMGVNDKEQIKNQNFHSDDEIINALVKTSCNKASRSNVEITFEKLINSAHLVCVFGSSFGETDKYWWELIGKRLMDESMRMIAFVKDGDKKYDRRPYKKLPIETNFKKKLTNLMDLSNYDFGSISKRIHIVINSKIFQY